MTRCAAGDVKIFFNRRLFFVFCGCIKSLLYCIINFVKLLEVGPRKRKHYLMYFCVRLSFKQIERPIIMTWQIIQWFKNSKLCETKQSKKKNKFKSYVLIFFSNFFSLTLFYVKLSNGVTDTNRYRRHFFYITMMSSYINGWVKYYFHHVYVGHTSLSISICTIYSTKSFLSFSPYK